MNVLPPVNGKRLWRVKRSVSTGGATDNLSSIECLNNSLKISAAGRQYTTKRPPLKRPRNKPGMPKDFVFVDLSPIKSDEDSDASSVVSALPSPVMSCTSSTLAMEPSMTEYNMADVSELNLSFEDSVFDDSALLGLGLLNVSVDPMGFDMHAFEQDSVDPLDGFLPPAPIEQFVPLDASEIMAMPLFAAPSCPEPQTLSAGHQRSRSMSQIPKSRTAGGLQFKSYAGPGIKKPTRKVVKRCFSEPMPHQVCAPLIEHDISQSYDLLYSPLMEIQEPTLDSLLQPISLDVFPNPKLFKDDFDLSRFVAL